MPKKQEKMPGDKKAKRRGPKKKTYKNLDAAVKAAQADPKFMEELDQMDKDYRACQRPPDRTIYIGSRK